jgi:hypothetical protein
MKHFERYINLTFLIGLQFLIFSKEAKAAYLDPGSGSFMIQMIIASLVGISFFIKMFWKNIKLFLSSHFSEKQQQE